MIFITNNILTVYNKNVIFVIKYCTCNIVIVLFCCVDLQGAESRHNLSYWNGTQYIGVGPGAHGR